MKRLLILCALVMSMASCSISDDNANNFHTEFLPIESVEMPTEFVLGETYEFRVSYLRPTGCHVFNNFYFDSNLNQRTIAVITTVYENNSCELLENELVEATFNFLVTSNGTYVFRFWQGEDENGNDIYYIVEVPVVD